MASFSIETGSSTVLMALLQDGALDLILAARVESTNEDVVQLPLPPVHLEIVARTEYARRAKFRTLADLSGERWLLPARSLYLRQLLDERFASSGLPAPQVTVEVAATPMAFTELLRKSDLLSILPSQMLQQAEGVGLTALAGQGMSSQHDLAILWRAGGYLSPICQDFRDAVAQWNQTSLA